jgi:hypothetical protein
MAGQLDRNLVKIANGAALSGEIDLASRRIVAIQGAPAWTAAALSFQGRATVDAGEDKTVTPSASVPAPALGEILDDAGAAIAVSMAANAYVVLTGPEREALASVRHIKIRSGTSGAPVNQGADRYLWLVLEPRGF